MRREVSPWVRAVAGALTVAVGLAFAAPPVAAEEVAPPAPPAQKITLAAAAEAKLAKLDPADALAPIQDPAGAAGDGKPFLKTPKGMLALGLMIAGTAYTFYSKKEDRILSPIRE